MVDWEKVAADNNLSVVDFISEIMTCAIGIADMHMDKTGDEKFDITYDVDEENNENNVVGWRLTIERIMQNE